MHVAEQDELAGRAALVGEREFVGPGRRGLAGRAPAVLDGVQYETLWLLRLWPWGFSVAPMERSAGAGAAAPLSEMPSRAAKSASAWSASAVISASLMSTCVMSTESLATRARPAALSRSSMTMLFEAVERVAGAADVRDHAGRHLVDLGHGLLHAHVVDGALEAFDLGARGLHGDVAGLDQVLVGGLGLLELRAVLGRAALRPSAGAARTGRRRSCCRRARARWSWRAGLSARLRACAPGS